jgi:hypothetical protein
MISSEQRYRSKEDDEQKRSRTVKSEVIPEDKSLVNVLYIFEVNNCGYNCEYFNKVSDQIRSPQLITVAETLTCDNIVSYYAGISRKEQGKLLKTLGQDSQSPGQGFSSGPYE